MSAQPAESDYGQSHDGASPVRPAARVIQLPVPRSDGQTTPDQDTQETPQTGVVESGVQSGTRLTLRDFPGEWESVTAVWTDSPEPLRVLVARWRGANDDDRTPADVALAVWAALVMPARAALHLGSWVLTHPIRLLVVTALGAVLLATY